LLGGNTSNSNEVYFVAALADANFYAWQSSVSEPASSFIAVTAEYPYSKKA
jgi:hypothetical protein